MIDARADVTVPVPPAEAFAAATDLEHADWVPAVRRLRRIDGSPAGIGARYAVEVGIIGRHLSGVLLCTELEPPRRARYELENGLALSITLTIRDVPGGSNIELVASYAVGGGPFGGAVERASVGPARREVARAVEKLAARFGRRAGRPRSTSRPA